MEILGAVSASADLLKLSIKASKTAKGLVQSFIAAPTELVELATELERLHAKLEQIQGLCDGITTAPTSPSGSESFPIADTLLPPNHRQALYMALQKSLEALQNIQRLCSREHVEGTHGNIGKMPASLQDVRHRIQWAAINKRKALHIIEDVKLAQGGVVDVLHILSMRLVLLNQISLNAVSTSQTRGFAALHAALETMGQDLKAYVHSEMVTVVEKVSTPKDTMRTPSCSTSQHGAEGSPNLVPPKSPRQTIIDEIDERERRLIEHSTRRTLNRNSAAFGDFRGILATTATDTNTNTPKMGAVVTYESKRNRRKVKIAFFVRFRLFCNRIFNFDVEMQQWCSRGGGKPWIGCSMTLFNIRPHDAPIFLACRRWDFHQVRHLIECGEASLYDVNEETGGLLENVFEGEGSTHIYHNHIARPECGFGRGLRLLTYLLDQGCDPNTFHGLISRSRMPAVLKAFEMGYMSTVSTLMAHGADLSFFGSTVATLLDFRNDRREFPWKVRTLRDIGFSDWKVDTEGDNLLYGACWATSLEELLFALEIAGIDPNIVGGLGRAPIGNAAQSKSFFQGVAILIEYGAKVNVGTNTWNGTPLLRSFDGYRRMSDMAHYLLSRGANPRLPNSMNETVWSHCINAAFGGVSSIHPVAWSFPRMEGELTHLLLHNADPFELIAVFKDPEEEFESDSDVDEEPALWNPAWSTHVQQVRLLEACRAWSYALPIENHFRWSRDRFKTDFELREQTREPRFACKWSPSRLIYHASFETDSACSEDSISSHYDDTDTEDENAESPIAECSRPGKQVSPWNDPLGEAGNHSSDDGNATEEGEDDSTGGEEDIVSEGEEDLSASEKDVNLFHAGNSSEDEDDISSANRSSHLSESSYEDPVIDYWREDAPRGRFHFPSNASSFSRHISTEEGRRQLARFPLVRAFCDALGHAGFRAEMDHDGDIWYDADGDGERYYDARERQPVKEREDWPVEECPICRDFKAYGLGFILEEVAEGKRKLREYKEQVKRLKRRYF